MRKPVLALVALLAVTGAALALAFGVDSRQATAVTGPNFVMSVSGNQCHPSTQADCDIDANALFTLRISVQKTNLPQYRGFQVKLIGSNALPYVNRPGFQEIVWPPCEIAYDDATQPPMYRTACTRTSSGTMYLGEVVQVDYQCGALSSTVHTITMQQGAATDSTYLVDYDYHIVDPEGGDSKTFTVRCFGTGTPPTATATPIATDTATPSPTTMAATNTPSPTAMPSTTPTPAGLTGDANGDFEVNAIDAALILQHTAGLLASLGSTADANEDGHIDSIDASLVLQYVAGFIGHLPP